MITTRWGRLVDECAYELGTRNLLFRVTVSILRVAHVTEVNGVVTRVRRVVSSVFCTFI